MTTVADESKNLDGVEALLRDKCGLATTSLEDRTTVKRVAVMVGLRAARLAAMAVASVASMIEAVDSKAARCHVGIDGSVFLKFPNFKQVRTHPRVGVEWWGVWREEAGAVRIGRVRDAGP